MNDTHEHEFLGTYLRGDMILYSGEDMADRYALMCDCGEIKEEKKLTPKHKNLDDFIKNRSKRRW